MNQAATLFVSTFTTLLAIINPIESLPVFLRLLQGKDQRAHRLVARRACTHATLLLFFFLIFGTLRLEIFEVPLSMVRIAGGIILMRIGFSLFLPSAAATSLVADFPAGASWDVAFVPLAMPLMFGPAAIAIVLAWRRSCGIGWRRFCRWRRSLSPSWRRWARPICSSSMPT